VFINELTSSGAIPSLELSVRFAAGRQRMIAHNVANLSTPDFRPMDVSPRAFQRALAEAVDRRRARTGGETGELDFQGNREVAVGREGRITLTPRTPSSGILAHDRNNRDLERTMQDLVENAAAFRVATDLLRSRYQILGSAIAERI
jgi:flagellar basal-body rod protein FlgB